MEKAENKNPLEILSVAVENAHGITDEDRANRRLDNDWKTYHAAVREENPEAYKLRPNKPQEPSIDRLELPLLGPARVGTKTLLEEF